MDQHDRCPICLKKTYRRWRDAERDCRAIRAHVKRARTLHPYHSRSCGCVHLTNQITRKRVAA